MNERKLAPTLAAIRLLEGDYYSDADAWNLACSDDFARGVGIALGLRPPADLAGRRTGHMLRVPGEDMHPDGRAEQAARIAGYEWARQAAWVRARPGGW